MPSLAEDGFCVVPDVLSPAGVNELLARTEAMNGSAVHGRRDLLDFPFIRDFAQSEPVRALVEPILGAGCFAVRGLFFDKTPDANWLVPRHQDLTIAVAERCEVEGFGSWSQKDGVPHVQPPREVLESMLSLRLHLDECDESNGALRVISGSHASGKLSALEIAAWFQRRGEVVVPMALGGAMLFRPLLIHASSPAQLPRHRRVVHLEFAARELPETLKWKWNV